MADDKKKGDFDKSGSRKDEVGGNKKTDAKPGSKSRTGHKQNAGHGGHQ